MGLLVCVAGAGAPVLATDILTLDAAVERVLEQNPRLQAADLAWQASEARTDQAGLRPNPELDVEWENLAGSGDLSGVGASELTLMLSQNFELGGKRGRRRDLAAGYGHLADCGRRILRLDLILRTKEVFTDVWAAQSRLVLAAEQTDLFAELLREIQRRIAAGAASKAEVSRARVGLAAAEMDHRRCDRQLQSTRRRLAALWNAAEPDFSEVTGDFQAAATIAPAADAKTLVAGNPDLAHWRARETLQVLAQDLARADGKPDLNLGLGVKRHNETGDQTLVMGAGLPLPLFDRNEGEVRAAGHELEQIRRQREAAEMILRTELDLARQDEQAALDEIRTLRDDIVPQATEAFDATLAGHQQGLFSFTDVLETRRFLVELRESYIDALSRHHLAVARIQRLIGAEDTGSAAAAREDSR